MTIEIIFIHNFFGNILKIPRKFSLSLGLKVLKDFPAQKVIKICFLGEFSSLEIKSKTSENYFFFSILQDFYSKIIFFSNNGDLILYKKIFFLVNCNKIKKIGRERIYLSPIKFIQKNFPQILVNSYDFYCHTILHEKDFLWNNLVSEFFCKGIFEFPIVINSHILILLKILSDTFWLLNEQYGKIQKRGKHGCRYTYCLEFFKIFFFKIKNLCELTSNYKNLFRKQKKIKILRKDKLKNSSIYLRMVAKKESLFFKHFLMRKKFFIFLIELSKLLESYAFNIESSLKRYDVQLEKA